MKVLLPIDGSAGSRAAARQVIRHAPALLDADRPTLLFVDAPLIAGARRALGAKGTARYHAGNATLALGPVRALFRRAGIAFDEQLATGDPAGEITRIAHGGFDLVAMGSRGHGALGSFLLGSVANKVLARCKVPVLLAR
jgi:nucleotide-binding universal stress UspA family protein